MSPRLAMTHDEYQMPKVIRNQNNEDAHARAVASPFWTSSFFRQSSIVICYSLGLSLLLSGSLGAVEPVQLTPYPQKVRAFYSLSSAAVPAALRSNAVPLPVGNL